MIQGLSAQGETALQTGLAQLVDAELLYQRGRPPRARYLFKHALIQDAAYASLLRSTRQQVHRQVAQMLEGLFADTAETQPELLAYHYTEAGLAEPAVAYWTRAGQRAVERSAHTEAMAHLTKGLAVLEALPDIPERQRHELTLQTTMGPALIATKGYGAPELERTYARARTLCQQVGETPELPRILLGLARFSLLRAEMQKARELGEELLTLAQRRHDHQVC